MLLFSTSSVCFSVGYSIFPHQSITSWALTAQTRGTKLCHQCHQWKKEQIEVLQSKTNIGQVQNLFFLCQEHQMKAVLLLLGCERTHCLMLQWKSVTFWLLCHKGCPTPLVSPGGFAQEGPHWRPAGDFGLVCVMLESKCCYFPQTPFFIWITNTASNSMLSLKSIECRLPPSSDFAHWALISQGAPGWLF